MSVTAENVRTGAGATRHVAEYVVETSLSDVPSAAIHGAKLSILDTLGCSLAALDQPTAQSILAYVEELGGTPVATIIGRGGAKTAPPLAAMANGAMMNVLDFDGIWHMPTYVLPSVLASAELVGASGTAVLEAFVLGVEVASRLRESIDALREQHQGPTYRGWYHVSVYGPAAAAVAAGKVLGLNVDQMRAAIGVAANGCGGVRQNLGTTAKSLLSGNSAYHGVAAALLARSGVSGDPDILEARLGLVAALCLPGECDWEPLFSLLGSQYTLATGPDIKVFPSVGPTQPVIATLQKLRADEHFDLTKVVSVEAKLSSFSAGLDYPTDPLMAGFSWPYVLAATLVDGAFTVNHLTDASLREPAIRDRTQLFQFLQTTGAETESLTITLEDDRKLSASVDPEEAVEHGTLPVMTKFRTCAQRHLGDAQVERLQDIVMTLETQSAASTLSTALQ